jgi:hypothetical protein
MAKRVAEKRAWQRGSELQFTPSFEELRQKCLGMNWASAPEEMHFDLFCKL